MVYFFCCSGYQMLKGQVVLVLFVRMVGGWTRADLHERKSVGYS